MTTYLEQVELFAGLAPAQLEALSRSAQTRVFPRGAVVLNAGDSAHGLFVVQTGSLKAFVMDENGRELTLSIHGPGDYFGELALLDDAPRSASVIALERCELMHVARPAFLALIDANPESMHVLLRNLVRRIRALTDNVQALALEDVFGRLHRLLESLAEPRGEQWIVEPRLTQQEIANRVGASREMVNRIVRELVIGGYLALEPQRIVIRRRLPARW